MSLATDLTAISANNKTIIDNSNKAVELNNELEQILYGTDTGGKSYYDEFWDVYQDNGKLRNYTAAFAGFGWATAETFKPKYDIIPVTPTQMFARGSFSGDLVAYLNNIGITLDFSQCTSFLEFSYYTNVTRFGIIDTRSAKNLNSIMAYTMEKLKTVDLLILKSDGSQSFANNSFIRCDGLSHLMVEGLFGCSVSFLWSPLTVESAISVITHLKDYSGTDGEFTNTLTLSETTRITLEAESSTSPNGNKWTEYITDIGWLLN